jgi:uncharacterized protein YxjI
MVTALRVCGAQSWRVSSLDVTIQERKFSFFTEYDITTPDATLYAKKQAIALLNKLELQTSSGQVLAKVQAEFSLLRHKYDFDLLDGRVFHFQCDKLWTSVYRCTYGGDVYTLYEHRGLNRSIFRADRQIAAYSKNRISFGKGNEYAIRMDSDADLNLILCMVLALGMSEDNDDHQTVSIDFGNIGPEARPFDDSWEPKG